MILRRLTEHVRTQNWLAVALDFGIVVLGVFLGVQIGNWNEARADRAAYEEALARFEAEIAVNSSELERVMADLGGSLPDVEAAIEALQACEDGAEAVAAVDRALARARSTASIHLRRASLDALTTDPVLLSLESAEERKRFADLAFVFDLFALEANWAEFQPLDERIENVPVLGVGAPTDPRETIYAGRTQQAGKRYSLVLAAPVSEACAQGELIKALFSWRRWQSNLPPLSRDVLTELQATQELLAARR